MSQPWEPTESNNNLLKLIIIIIIVRSFVHSFPVKEETKLCALVLRSGRANLERRDIHQVGDNLSQPAGKKSAAAAAAVKENKETIWLRLSGARLKYIQFKVLIRICVRRKWKRRRNWTQAKETCLPNWLRELFAFVLTQTHTHTHKICRTKP